jgi:HD-like signal output (HDOD) protein
MADVGRDRFRSWLERLKPVAPLPVFGHSLVQFRALRDVAEILTAADVARVVLPDPFFVLNVLHVANSRVSRPLGAEITTVEHAIVMLGIEPALRRFGELRTAEQDLAADRHALSAVYELARRSQHAAWQARDFAVLRADIYAEEVWVAALLAFVPELVIALKFPEDFRGLRRTGANPQAQRAAIGASLVELRQAFLESWLVPELTRDLLDPSRRDRPRVRDVLLASQIAEHAERGWWRQELRQSVREAAGLLHKTEGEMATIIHRNAVAAARALPWNPAPSAAAWLPMLEGEWPAEADEQRVPAQEFQAGHQGGVFAAEAAHGEAVCLIPHRDKFDAVMAQFEPDAASGMDLPQLAVLLLKGLREGLGLSRVLFAQVAPDGAWVKPRFSLGVPDDAPLKRFAFPLTGGHLFHRLMTKPQGIWYGEENRKKFESLLPDPLRVILGREFLAMSVQVNGRPFALIYADRGAGDACHLDNAVYTSFKLLCLKAGQRLARTCVHAPE